MVDKKLSEFSQITPSEIAKLICLYLDQNNAIKNGVVDFAALDALLAHKADDETFTGNKTFAGDAVFSGNATFNKTVNANVSGSSGSCTGNSATATKATQDGSGNNIVNTYATKTELAGKVDLNLNNMNPSATAKETIVGWGLPDLTTGVSQSSSGFTSTKKQWIRANVRSQGYDAKIYVNGEEVLGGQIAGTTSAPIYFETWYPLDAGDVVTTSLGTNSSVTMYTFDMKGL